jgi:hypothetical protein
MFARLLAKAERSWGRPELGGGCIMTDSVIARVAALKTTPTPALKAM